MATDRKIQLPPLEPLGWSHWRAALLGLPEAGAFEFGCYTDVWVTGEVATGLGPLQLLNPVSSVMGDGGAAMSIVARFSAHRPEEQVASMRLQTSYSRYIAVDVGEELAALVSLALGVRCRSGGLIREFRLDGDPRGRHLGYDHRAPYLQRPAMLHGTQLPRIARDAAGRQREITLPDALPLLRRYPFASQKKAIALVRAGRLYGDAVWTADADPQGAWLALVTACEVAAAHRYGSHDPKNRRQRRHGPNPTERFTRFLARYATDPPQERPKLGRLDWTRMGSHAEWIYHWRSRALHDGVPFPPAMVQIPSTDGSDNMPAEVPLGLGSSTGTSSWRRETTPMLLHTFAFIVRGALTRWWAETRVRAPV